MDHDSGQDTILIIIYCSFCSVFSNLKAQLWHKYFVYQPARPLDSLADPLLSAAEGAEDYC